MADISKINEYVLKDKIARDNHDALVKEVNDTIDAINEALEGLEYTLPVATSSDLGGIKIGYTASGANLPVALLNQKAYVALTKSAVTSALGYTPPTTNTTYSVATASKEGLVKPVSVITKPTLNPVTTTSGKYYQVQMSSDGNMFVNVPWVKGEGNVEPLVISAVFSYLFSNASKALDVTSTKDKYGEVQWYSSDGEAVSVNLSKIGYVIELFDAMSASLRLHRSDYTNSDDTVNFGSISNENGNKVIDYSTGPYTKNTTIIFSLLFTDNLERKFAVDSVVKISFPIYYGAAERATDIVSYGTKENISSIKGTKKTVLIESTNKYIWFITTEIIDDISSNGFYAGFVLYDDIVIGDATYNCYRSTYPIQPGTYIFDIK